MESKQEIKQEIKQDDSRDKRHSDSFASAAKGVKCDNSVKVEKGGDKIKREREEREDIRDNKHMKLVRASEIVGKNPNMMIQMLYDKKTKTPFMYSMNLGNTGIHIYSIFKWASDNNIQFAYNTDENDIIMYAYTFMENNHEHDLIICDIAFGKNAISECERQKLIPFNDSTHDNGDSTKYDNILKVQKNGKLSVQNRENHMSSNITTNIITFEFINHIVKYMKDTKKSIKIMEYDVIDFNESSQFDTMLQSMLSSILSDMFGSR